MKLTECNKIPDFIVRMFLFFLFIFLIIMVGGSEDVELSKFKSCLAPLNEKGTKYLKFDNGEIGCYKQFFYCLF